MTKTVVSALFDDELDAEEMERFFSARGDIEAARQSCAEYGMIGDVLRGKKVPGRDLSQFVMAALEHEPVVLAPRSRPVSRWQRPALALAASIAGVAIVASVALMPQSQQPEALAIAQNNPVAQTAPPPSELNGNDLQEFLIAHQAHSVAGNFGGGSQQVRTVSLVDQRGAR